MCGVVDYFFSATFIPNIFRFDKYVSIYAEYVCRNAYRSSCKACTKPHRSQCTSKGLGNMYDFPHLKLLYEYRETDGRTYSSRRSSKMLTCVKTVGLGG
jgi:hypothetical protein